MRNAPRRRRRRSAIFCRHFISLLACICWAATPSLQLRSETAAETSASPHRDFRHAESPTIPDLRSSFADVNAGIAIGYFGPFESDQDPDTSAWLAAEMAREDIAGECLDGRPLKLSPAWSESPWTGGAAVLSDIIFRQQALGIIGGIDGEATHLAETLVAKAHVPLISAVSTAKSVNLANVPWTFSVLPGDHLIAPQLAQRLAVSARSLAVISGPDHDSRGFWQELRPHLPADRITLAGLWIVQSSGKEEEQSLAAIAAKIVSANPECVLVTARAPIAAHAVLTLRAAGYSGILATDARGGRRAFLETVGDSAEGILCPLVIEPSDRLEDWLARFESRFNRKADYAAAATYDATCLLLRAAIRASSPQQPIVDRANIARLLRDSAPYLGITGRIEWDDLGANRRPAQIGVIRKGKLQPATPVPDGTPARSNATDSHDVGQ